MKSVAHPEDLQALIARVENLTPDHQRKWGTLTPHEMLCHLGDSGEMMLRTRPRVPPPRHRRRSILKWAGVWLPIPWPRGFPTGPNQNPKIDGTRPSVFESDRRRVIASLRAVAVAGPATLEAAHPVFGFMSTSDWQRFAWKHSDHHLRQFGV